MAKVQIETSARHVHVTQETLETLFGKGATLTPKKDLSQPGQFACAERIDVVGPKRTLSGVSILGPCRKADQVEISLTDARSIGVAAASWWVPAARWRLKRASSLPSATSTPPRRMPPLWVLPIRRSSP